MKLLLSVLAALVSGCALLMTDVNGARRSWNGAAYAEVESQWGTPARSAKLADGRDAHTWVSEGRLSRLFPVVGVFAGTGGGGVGATVATQPVGPLSRCERTLIFKDGRVVDQAWVGDGEYCSTFVRH